MLRFTRIRSWQRLSSLLNFGNSLLQSTSLRASTSASGTRLLSHILSSLIILSYLQVQVPRPQEPVSYPIYYLILSFYLLIHWPTLKWSPASFKYHHFRFLIKKFCFQGAMPGFCPSKNAKTHHYDWQCWPRLRKAWPKICKRIDKAFFRPCWITLGAATS